MNLDQELQHRSLLDQARNALEAGLPEAARDLCESAIELDPGSSEARLLQAQISLALNQPKQAVTALHAHDMYHPEERGAPGPALLRAQTFLRCGEYELAQGVLTPLTQQFPDDIRPWAMMAQLMVKSGRAHLALEHLRQVARLSGTPAARTALVEALAAVDPQGAVDVLRSNWLIEDATARLREARLLRRVERLREAADSYEALLNGKPRDAALWLEAGALNDTLGSDELARRQLEAALKNGAGAEGQKTLAMVHMHAGRLQQAGRCWWELARRDEKNTRAWAGLLVCALALGKVKLAGRVQRELERRSSRQERRALMAEFWPHAAGGAAVRSARLEESELAAGPTSPLTRLLRDASQALRGQAREHPNRADAQYHAAVAGEALGDHKAAVEAVGAALAINPRYAAAKALAERLGEIVARAA